MDTKAHGSDRLTAHEAEIVELCRRFGVRYLAAFGSSTTDAFRQGESDVDLLVEFLESGPGYADRYFGLLESLESLFGRSVDLVIDSAISNPYFRESVESTKTQLYAA
jgi:predicted nucleotidyltransferase